MTWLATDNYRGHIHRILHPYLAASRAFRHLVVTSGVRAASTLDTCDDEPSVVLPEAHGEPELSDAYLLVQAVLERLAVEAVIVCQERTRGRYVPPTRRAMSS
jgi:hypothetical protein